MSDLTARLTEIKISVPYIRAQIKGDADAILYILASRASALAFQVATIEKAQADISRAKAEAMSLTSSPAPLWQIEEVERKFKSLCEEALDKVFAIQPDIGPSLEHEVQVQRDAAREAL